jgi:hypothetical protein
MSTKETLKTGRTAATHLAAVAAGFVAMVVGLGMGVTVIALPVGVPLGLVGLGLFLWGLWGFGEARRREKGQG